MILAKRLMMCLLKTGWGGWIVNSGVTVNATGIAHYTAYKTNQREYYDSYANLDLTEAIVRSLHDDGMQQWQAVKDACDELTGVTDWVFDVVNSRIVYTSPSSDPRSIEYQYYYSIDDTILVLKTPNEVCQAWNDQGLYNDWAGLYYYDAADGDYGRCRAPGYYTGWPIYRYANPLYDPNALVINQYVSFSTIAQKIISNASSSNQTISLMAEAYLENVAQSIFNSDESKQFVKLSDLIYQFEENKVLRI